MREFRGHDGWVFAVAYSPDGTTLASAGRDATVRVWDVASGAQRLSFRHPATGLPRTCYLCVAFSPDGSRLFAGDAVRPPAFAAIRAWELPSGRPLRVFGNQNVQVHSLCVSSRGTRVASAHASPTVYLWDAASGRQIRRIPFNDFQEVRVMTWSPDDRTIAVASLWAQSGGQVWPVRIVLWNVRSSQRWADLGTFNDDSALALAFSRDSRTLAAGFESGNIRLWDARTGTLLNYVEGHRQRVLALAFTPDGATLLAASEGGVRLWNVSDGAELRTYDWGIGTVHTIAVAPDGMTAAAGGEDGRVILWDLE
jgi:WD40 repeat protein